MIRTAKHQALVSDPVIRYKSVESLPGISPVYGRRLRDAGFDTADKVLEKYLALKRNEQRFTLWLSQVCGANSPHASICFSGLNECMKPLKACLRSNQESNRLLMKVASLHSFTKQRTKHPLAEELIHENHTLSSKSLNQCIPRYRSWGKENLNIKSPTGSISNQNRLTNRMLLEQKILQLNLNSTDDCLRSFPQCQAMSLGDISSSQRVMVDVMNKSHPNIFNGFQNSSETSSKFRRESNKSQPNIFTGIQYPSEGNLRIRRETNKSQPNIFTSARYPSETKKKIGIEGKCSSLTSLMTPVQKSVNFKENEIIDTSTPRKFVGLSSAKRTISPILKSRSLTPEIKISTYDKPKEIKIKPENIPKKGNSTFPRNVSQKINNLNPRKPPYRKDLDSGLRPEKTRKCSQANENLETTQRIKRMENEGFRVFNIESDSTSFSPGHLNISRDIEKYLQEVKNIDESSKMFNSIKNNRQDSVSSSSISPCNFQSEDSAFDVTVESQSVSTGDEAESMGTETDSNLTGSFEVLPRALSSDSKQNDSCPESDSTDTLGLEETNNEDGNQGISPKATPPLPASEGYCENSNEDSGLDVNTNGLIEYPNESEPSDDECPTPVENIESLSESNTDRTFEVNEETELKCTCNFVASESVSGSETVNSGENLENQMEHDDESGNGGKRENIRLFCDMLSNDLEQLPMDKLRNLKLNILQLVYAELNECGST